jgi:hypothetical protein
MPNSIYEEIYPFCQVRNLGTFFSNQAGEPQPRVKFLIDLLKRYGVEHVLDEFTSASGVGHNIILPGGARLLVAHHDIVNPDSDNANDNSASVINAIALKLLLPEVTVVILDGEEVGGMGSTRLAEQIGRGEFGEVEWALNLELTGLGGDRFFAGNYPGKLLDRILEKFDCPVCTTPFNDSVILRAHSIDSCVINPLPVLSKGQSRVKWGEEYLDWSLLYNCHSEKDSIDTICVEDMKKFVEEVLIKILV